MNQDKDKVAADRRSFLKLAGIGTAAAAAGATVIGEAVEAKAADAPAKEGSYRETAHVRRYYDLARF